jgi:predicted O-linked N-acetylglucosamine transferase (SPINDLY family)/glycosyltransferase involved in cell wall biosynthesis
MLADFAPETLAGPPSFGRVRAMLAKHQDAPADEAVRAELQTALRAASAELAALPRANLQSPAVQAGRELVQAVSISGIHDRAMEPSDLPRAEAAAAKGGPGLLAAMLLVPAWQWPDAPALATVPHGLWGDYTAWLFAAPQGFAATGDADKYAAHILRRLEDLLAATERNAQAPASRAALEAYVRCASGIPLYFYAGNLRRHAELRARLLALWLGRDLREARGTDVPAPARAGRRLRVGFINRHFGPQTETYTTLPSFEQLDPQRFEVILFTCHKNGSPLEDYCASRAAEFHVLPRDLTGQLATLRAAGLDVAVFGTNVTAVANEVAWLALHRVAPLQVVNNSSCITTGFPTVDLYVSGTLTETPQAPEQFTERLALLPGPAHAFNYNADRRNPESRWSREALGLPADATVFVSAANYFKVIPEMQHTWARLLASVPGSYLLLHPFNPNWSSSYPIKRFCADFDRVLAEHGVPGSQLIVSSMKFPTRSDVKELLRVGDVYLDTFPFGGVNSLIDPLEIGVPVVAWEGDSFRSRMGGALLRALGVPELVAANEAGYLAQVTELVADAPRRRELGASLQAKMERMPVFLDPLAASDAFGALLETAYDELAAAGRTVFRRTHTPIRAQAGDPASPQLRHQLGRQLLTLDRPDRALVYLLAAVQHEEGNAALWHDLAWAFQALKQPAQALQAAEACLRVDPKNLDGWLLLAELAREAGHADFFREARATLQDLASTDPRVVALASVVVAGNPPAMEKPTPAPGPGHVLLYTDDPEFGGVAQYNHNLLLALTRAGYRVSCVQTRSDSPLVREQQAAGVRHHWLDYHTGREFARTVSDPADAERIFRAERPDLIVFSDCCPVSNLAARQVAMTRGIPYVAVVGFVGAYLAKSFAAQLPLLAAQYAAARAVVAVSQENLALLRRHFGLGADRGEIIHYGRPAKFFAPRDPAVRARLRAEAGLPEDAIVCFTAARLTAIKGFGHQLQAARQLLGTRLGSRIHFVWAGDGEQRAELEREIAAFGLGGQVRLLGQRWDVADWHDAADIFVLPSQLEGMPLAIMEAMAKGLPVVATAVSGIPEELGDTGQLLPDPATDAAGVVRGLVETIGAWAADPAKRIEAGRRGRERALELFREELMISRSLALLQRHLPVASA